jgi:hypothetical protein
MNPDKVTERVNFFSKIGEHIFSAGSPFICLLTEETGKKNKK